MKKTSRMDAVKDKASDLVESGSASLGTATAAVAPAVEDAVQHVVETAEDVARAAAPQVEKVRELAAPHLESAKGTLAPAAEQVRQTVAPAVEKVKELAGPAVASARQTLTPAAEQVKQVVAPAAEQVRERIQPAADRAREVAAPATSAVVAQVTAPFAKQKKKGKLLIVAGITLAAVAAYLIYQDRKRRAATQHAAVSTAPAAAPAKGGDLVGDVERKADGEVSGTDPSRGKHAAKD